MVIKNNDFIEIEYTGKVKDGPIFDTTDEKIAKDNNIYNEKMEFGPIVICVGEQQVIRGLDKKLIDKELGTYNIELNPEDAFGKKSAKLIQLISTSKFKQQNIEPIPGLQVNIDGIIGIIKTVSGGRTLVDFNHPLAGKNIIYNVKINRIITDPKEKIISFLKVGLNLKDVEVKVENNKASIFLKKKFPKEIKDQIIKKLKELTKTEIQFKVKTNQNSIKSNNQKKH